MVLIMILKIVDNSTNVDKRDLINIYSADYTNIKIIEDNENRFN